MQLRHRSSANDKGQKSSDAKRLLDSNDVLSSEEQETVLSYLSESNDTSNRVFLVVLAILHGIVGGIYLFLFVSRDRTLVFLMSPQSPLMVIRGAMLLSSLLLFCGGVRVARFCRICVYNPDVDQWLMASRDRKESLASHETTQLKDKFSLERRFHIVLAAAAALPSLLFACEVILMGDWTMLDIITAIWQPLLHMGVCMVLQWMQETQLAVVQLLLNTYTLEKA